jgi:CheY-like chemotaxis protein
MTVLPHLVFVVDDDPLLRMQAVDLLDEAGFPTLEAETADEAMAILRHRWPEVRVLFTDVQMPGSMTGIELAEEVHRCWPDIHLLVTSGGVHIRDADLPDDGRFMPKPYRPSGLIEQVKDMIARGHPAEGRPGLPL